MRCGIIFLGGDLMSFANKNDNLSMNKKQRLNLSKSAKEVLENDDGEFELDSGEHNYSAILEFHLID